MSSENQLPLKDYSLITYDIYAFRRIHSDYLPKQYHRFICLIYSFCVAGPLTVKNLLRIFIQECLETHDVGGGSFGFQGGRGIIDGQEARKRSDCHLPAVYRTHRDVSSADLPFC